MLEALWLTAATAGEIWMTDRVPAAAAGESPPPPDYRRYHRAVGEPSMVYESASLGCGTLHRAHAAAALGVTQNSSTDAPHYKGVKDGATRARITAVHRGSGWSSRVQGAGKPASGGVTSIGGRGTRERSVIRNGRMPQGPSKAKVERRAGVATRDVVVEVRGLDRTTVIQKVMGAYKLQNKKELLADWPREMDRETKRRLFSRQSGAQHNNRVHTTAVVDEGRRRAAMGLSYGSKYSPDLRAMEGLSSQLVHSDSGNGRRVLFLMSSKAVDGRQRDYWEWNNGEHIDMAGRIVIDVGGAKDEEQRGGGRRRHRLVKREKAKKRRCAGKFTRHRNESEWLGRIGAITDTQRPRPNMETFTKFRIPPLPHGAVTRFMPNWCSERKSGNRVEVGGLGPQKRLNARVNAHSLDYTRI
ncbi:hypothetical protein R3P38DRAFT_3365661 [Favolaschia claudopus]|uniref:Uncharacterized protein n=1 Tax=Favolaschia claudopus TaxID=2862362 RepID=A0AAW0AFU3_9AGAR